MREKKTEILEYQLKKTLFSKSLNVISPVLIQKRDTAKNILKIAYTDCLTEIERFNKTAEITYPLGFFLCLTLGQDFDKIVKSEKLLEQTLSMVKQEVRWDMDNVSYEMAVFFSSTFMNELYKDISIDIYELNQANNTQTHFLQLRKEISKIVK